MLRKYLLPAVIAATALLTIVPEVSASAAARSHVLTIRREHGPMVRVGAILKANLKARTKATFFTPGTKTGVVCRSATVSNKVTRNPLVRRTAVEPLRSQSFRRCTTNIAPGLTVKRVQALHLPYRMTITGTSTHRITLVKPRTRITLGSPLGAITCTYGARAIHGIARNTDAGELNVFRNQIFTKMSGSAACPARGSFSAKFGPVRDFSVTGHPRVFVNDR